MDFLKRICRELVLAIPLCVIHIREGGTAHTQRVLEEITCYKLSSFLKLEKFRFDLAPVELLIETFCTLCINSTARPVSTLCSNKQDNNDKLSKQASDVTLNWESSNLMKTKAR